MATTPRKPIDLADEIIEEMSAHMETLKEALITYRDADDLPRGERAESRELAHEEAQAALDDLLGEASKLSPVLDKMA